LPAEFEPVHSSYAHGTMLEDARRLFESDRSGCLRVYFLVVEGLTETVSSCPKNYQPQSLDTLFALLRSAANIPGQLLDIFIIIIFF